MLFRAVLWNTYGECENFAQMTGHTGAVMDLAFSTDGDRLYTASTDKTVAIWDVASGLRTRKLRGQKRHTFMRLGPFG